MLGVLALQADRPEVAEDTIRKAIMVNPKNGEFHLNLGIALNAQGKQEESFTAIEKAVQLAPGNLEARYSLGVALLGQQRWEEAVQHFQRVVKKAPKHADALMNLAIAQLKSGAGEDSLKTFVKLRKLVPDQPGVLINHANALTETGRYREALETYDKVLQLVPDHPEALARRGSSRLKAMAGVPSMDVDADSQRKLALADLERALELAPRSIEVLNGLGRAHQSSGSHREAETYFRKALELKPGEPELVVNLATCLGKLDRDAEALDLLGSVDVRKDQSGQDILYGIARNLSDSGLFAESKSIISRFLEIGGLEENIFPLLAMDRGHRFADWEIERIEDLVDNQKDKATADLYFALAGHFDRSDEVDRSFHYLNLGNEAAAKRQPAYDRKAMEDTVDWLTETFTADFIRDRQRFGSEDVRPVFIVGMLRSGTTLVEQIIASHSQAFGAGELSTLAEITGADELRLGQKDTRQRLVGMGKAETTAIANGYLERLGRDAGDKTRVTDKMPYNFWRVGLAAILFPNCRFIHCRRDPRDNGFSIYQQFFSGVHPYAYDQENIAHYFGLQRRLTDHWHEVLSDRILALDYEEMITDQERESRRLIEHLGLDWEDACLEFHRTERKVKTASQWQVRQKIYTSSVEKWRRYEAHLRPLIEALEAQ